MALTIGLGLTLSSVGRSAGAAEPQPLPYPLEIREPAPKPDAPVPADSPLEQSEPTEPEEPKLFAPEPRPAPKPPRKVRPISLVPIVSTNAPPPLVWKWPTFSAANYVITAVGAGVTLGAAIVKPRAKHNLSGGILFDDGVRDTLRANKLADRYVFRDASDVGLSLTVSWPFAADALTSAWWYRGSRETAQEMALINLETLAVVGALQGATNVLVSRERPFGPGCGEGELPSDAIDCKNSFHYRSFFSGHSAFSFTGAALICVHHMENELLGPPWDALSCAGGYAVAATTATFRVVADVHYASDILLGAAVGTLVGYSIPLLHYRKVVGSSGSAGATPATQLQLNLVPAPGGVGLLGVF
jgi:membrane-associated phospholipid phosphatase